MLQILLTPDAEQMLRDRARATGEDVSDYAARLLTDALCAPSVDELLAPFRRQVEESDITDVNLDLLGESLRHEVWHEQQTQ